jgi:hypothetical protein
MIRSSLVQATLVPWLRQNGDVKVDSYLKLRITDFMDMTLKTEVLCRSRHWAVKELSLLEVELANYRPKELDRTRRIYQFKT